MIEKKHQNENLSTLTLEKSLIKQMKIQAIKDECHLKDITTRYVTEGLERDKRRSEEKG